MYSITRHARKKHQKHWFNYRLYSRQIINQPMDMELHTSRVMAAMELEEREPVQGALADMFYGCWFDVQNFGEHMLSQVREKLNDSVLADFERCITGKEYIQQVTPLATRWSVLTEPSMATYNNQLRISPDDSRRVAHMVISNLLEIYEEEEDDEERDEMFAEIEDEYFVHCLTTEDRLGFSMVWWELAKNDWKFGEGWDHVREQFAQQNAQAKRYHVTNES